MVKSQAGRFVPSTKESRLPQAFTRVSCTRSSARSGLPHRETAKARKFGMTAIKSALICALAWLGREMLFGTPVTHAPLPRILRPARFGPRRPRVEPVGRGNGQESAAQAPNYK